MLPFKNWTYPVGPILAVGLNSVLVLVQGWSCFSPTFSAVDFVSFYIEIAIMVVMFVFWKIFKRTKFRRLDEIDLVTDRYDLQPDYKARQEAREQGEVVTGRGKWFLALKEGQEGTWIGRVKRAAMWLFF